MSTSDLLQELEELASTQHGYVTRAQAANSGISDVELVRFCKRGDLQRMEHGIYKFRGAGFLRWEPVWIAWLRLDPKQPAFERTRKPQEVVGGRTAAWIYEIGDLDPEPYEFIVASRHQTRRTGLRFRLAVLGRTEWEIVEGLPVARPHKIVSDLLSQYVDVGHVADIAVDAVRRGLMSSNELIAAAQSAPSSDVFIEDVLARSKR